MKQSIQIILYSMAFMLASCAQDPQVDQGKEQNKDEIEQVEVNYNDEVKISQPKQGIEIVNYPVETISVLVESSADAKMIKMKEQNQSKSRMALIQRHSNMGHMPRRDIYPEPFFKRKTDSNTEKYSNQDDNATKLVNQQPVSTFSIDVDTASYANIRRILNQGTLPQYDAVRVEEFINYFSYDYPQPALSQPGISKQEGSQQEQAFSVFTEVAPSPFNKDKHLIHIGIQGKKIINSERPASNLVFLIDVSGSMKNPNKLGLLKNGLKMLTNQLNKQDKVAIVVYAGAAGTVLESTSGDKHHAITDALARLSAGGSTNGGAGILSAYSLARQSFIEGGINRVILATDGDFNVGTVNPNALKNMVVQQRKSGIDLSILGFGRGNYNDALMQELAQNGNGNAYYIDTLNEARKVLVEELSSTLMTIAKDVKIQVEFNPETVSEYRLIGYETRALKREDFNNDKVDAGDIGAGHTVTAIYEISLINGKNKLFDSLRYSSLNSKTLGTNSSRNKSEQVDERELLNNELAFLRLRYKLPEQDKSNLIEIPIKMSEIKSSFQGASNNFKFAAAVAGFGQLLRGGKNLSTMDLAEVISLAQNSKGADKNGYRGEFINMVKLAQALKPEVSKSVKKVIEPSVNGKMEPEARFQLISH